MTTGTIDENKLMKSLSKNGLGGFIKSEAFPKETSVHLSAFSESIIDVVSEFSETTTANQEGSIEVTRLIFFRFFLG